MKLNIISFLIWLFVLVTIVLFSYFHYVKALDIQPLKVDLRAVQLKEFFSDYSRRSHRVCPALKYVDDFLNISDVYNLDYRLLPALSIKESTCMEHGLYNNYFGIGSANPITSLEHYPTPIMGIERAAQMVIKYGLKRYGPADNPHYSSEVKAIMDEIK